LFTKTPPETTDDAQEAVVECEGLTKVYSSVWAGRSKAVCALRDVSLSVSKGRIVGLIGPNGAGKSTLLNLIAGLILPNQGRISICTHPARSIKARRCLGYMSEFPMFQGSYSARAVLKYHGALLDLSRRRISAEVDRTIQLMQLQEFADRPSSGFSQGMRQRLALAVAMMNNPKLLLLDEPSNGLDPIGIIQLRDVLKQSREAGTTIIVSSHRLEELGKLTSDYIFLYRGQIVSFDDRVVSRRTGRLRIGVLSGGHHVAERVVSPHELLDVSETELALAVGGIEDVPKIISDLVVGGAPITSVVLQKESIEDTFVRLYKNGN
jgi:ABC-2 type transport system ATP-binding protein